MRPEDDTPRRLLVIMPSWVGDVVMATPTLRALRERLPGALIGALIRPVARELLAGSDFFDEIHVDPRSGVMGPKKAAQKVRAARYDTALLLTGSFSSALAARLAWIPRRIGYQRDARALLLTDALLPPRRGDTPPYDRDAPRARDWAPVPACEYYLDLVRHLLDDPTIPLGPLELAITPDEEERADEILSGAGLDAARPKAVILNPGGNNPAKRWPAERFAALAAHLARGHDRNVLISGAPGERDLLEKIATDARAQLAAGPAEAIINLTDFDLSLGALKPIIRRCSLMVTNDTGPRHLAAALGTPVVTLFGPTDRRWTTIPFDDEIELSAAPDLPEHLVANDHPERCDIAEIATDTVIEAARRLLARAAH